MSIVKVSLDLTTKPGRAAMRAYLDALDVQELAGFAKGYHRGYKIGLDDGREVTGGEQPAGEEAETPPPAEVAAVESTSTAVDVPEAGGAAQQAAPATGSGAAPDPEDEDPGPVPIEDPEPPAVEPEPAPIDVVDVLPEGGASVVDADPERPWTDELKQQVWAMREAGVAAAAIAERLNLRKQRVWSFFTNVKHSSVKLPTRPARHVPAVVAPSAGALVAADRRHPAQDADMQADRLDELEEAERAKFVMKATHPEAFA